MKSLPALFVSCFIWITALSAQSPADSIGPTGPIIGPQVLCPDATAEYSTNAVFNATEYWWTAPPGALINGKSGTVTAGPVVTVSFGDKGGQLCVTPVNAQQQGTKRCINLSVQPISPTVLPTVSVCHEDIPYVTPWGQVVSASGTYQQVYQSALGCDSLVRQTVMVKFPLVVNMPLRAICPGDTIWVFGQPYTESGNYKATGSSFQGCDSVVNFTLLLLDPYPEIQYSGQPIPCTGGMATLLSKSNLGISWVWLNANGQTIGTGKNVVVSQPGLYELRVSLAGGGKVCTASDTVVVPSSDTLISNIALDRLSCDEVKLTATLNNPALQLAWLGPDGITKSGNPVLVDKGGVYYALVTDSVSGCVDAASIFAPLGTGLQLDRYPFAPCGADSLALAASVYDPGSTSFSWSGPNGFVSTQETPVVTLPGAYTLVVTDGLLGCVDTAVAEVFFPGDFPEVAVVDVQDATEGLANGSIELSVNPPDATVFWYADGALVGGTTSVSGLMPGTYVYQVQTQYGCATLDSVVVDQISAQVQPEVSPAAWKIFPVPTAGLLLLERAVGTAPEPVVVQVFNPAGACVLQTERLTGDRISLSLDQLPAGTYWLRVGGATDTAMYRVVLIR